MDVDRNCQEPNRIDYRALTAGLEHYEERGYEYTEVPWVVSKEATGVTLPIDRDAQTLIYGDLVGSGEQGFIELLMRGKKIGKACTITPCFRDESTFDDLHHAYFMKLELIDTDATLQNLQAMIADACEFFNKYINVVVVQTGENSYDINDKEHRIELGSYGFRSFNNITFIYGTGVALPRLTTVIGK